MSKTKDYFMDKEEEMENCTLCNEEGSIVESGEGYITSHSCKCGKYHRYIKEKFAAMFGGDPVEQINNLLSYGRQRVIDKGGK